MQDKPTCVCCKSPIKTSPKEGLGTVHFCPNYCNPRAVWYVCEHAETVIVRVGQTVRKQCQNCGEFVGGFFKKSDFDFNKLPVEDNSKKLRKEAFWNDVICRYSEKFRSIQSEKEAEKAHRLSQMQAEYKAYLRGEEWRKKRDLVFKRDNYLCQCCLTQTAVQVHHLTYANIFQENCFELISVCDPCHDRLHQIENSANENNANSR